MSDTILFVALPYLALFICVFGSIYRIRTQPFSYSSLSSQFLESKGLMWGSLPWHIGITVILLAHVVAFLVPGLWQSLMSNQTVLMAVESIGLGLSFLCLLGLIVLAVRRLTSPKVQAVTSTMDLVVIFCNMLLEIPIMEPGTPIINQEAHMLHPLLWQMVTKSRCIILLHTMGLHINMQLT